MKKSRPLFVFKIDPKEFKEHSDALKTIFNMESADELAEMSYILINEDGIKLPQGRDGTADPAISFKFLQNPVQIHDVDDLYEIFELNKDTPHKYFIMVRD